MRAGIILVNTGTPLEPTPEAVRGYLREFLTDPRICPMPPAVWKIILNAFILPRRSQASAQKYQMIWTDEGSPLAVAMGSLARKVDARLEGTKVVHALSYSAPSIRDSLDELRTNGCESMLVVPLYPQSAYSTTKAVEGQVQRELAAMDWAPHVEVVDGYADEDGYIEAIASSIREAGLTQSDRLLMAFHSIPMKDVNAGDTYGEQVARTAEAVADKLNLSPDRWRIGFQSRFDKSRKWLRPYTPEALASFPDKGGRLFIVTPNFSVDCLETLYDIDIELKQWLLAEDSSLAEGSIVYVPCLNDSDTHAAVLCKIISERIVRGDRYEG